MKTKKVASEGGPRRLSRAGRPACTPSYACRPAACFPLQGTPLANPDESANGCEKMGMKSSPRRRERRFFSETHRVYAEPCHDLAPCPSVCGAKKRGSSERARCRLSSAELPASLHPFQLVSPPTLTPLQGTTGRRPLQSITPHGAKSWGTGAGFADKNIALPPSPIETAQDTTRDARSYRCEEIGTQAARFRWPPPSTCA